MNINIPIYVEAHREKNPRRTVYQCEPLFSPGIQGRDESLPKAMGKLMKRLKLRLDSLASEARHDELEHFVFNPDCDMQTLKLSLDLRDRIVKCKLLFIEMKTLDRRIAFSPSLRELWFELEPGELLQDRATEILSRHFRSEAKMHRESGSEMTIPSIDGQAWVTVLDVPMAGGRAAQAKKQDKLASLFDDSKMHGATELDRVGRCLDWLYPDELKRAALREKEVAELERLLIGVDRRAVLLVGPRAVGKTTILHEFVYRRVQNRKRPYSAKKNSWLLSPQRLISGMSYVGQWENRVLAILKEARRRDHVLCFDDVMGLYQAGITADSRLCIADVLRSYVLRREVRIVGEMTPAALAAFQERDRGLADQFHILPIAPTNDEDTLRILLQVRRNLEADNGCRFEPDAVPTVLEVKRRYEGQAAFPGKAVSLLKHLSAHHPKAEIDRSVVYREFHSKTGLSLSLLDKRRRLTREAVVGGLRREIVGQAEAISAAADVITVAKAGLNDPQRPWATLLFLGPTGVGKTQCAKTLTKVLFTDESRLLRFDMNEFVSPDSAARLVGTASDPEGLLTAAVRRQPYSVVLFDEIEKAHPDVVDLLLQLTGEGRLTDALGRTSDFCNTVVVMTSNLGVRESGRSLGLRSDEASRRHTFVKAAEDFFRPEFFNRIDRVVPFEELGREDMQKIAELLLGDLLEREGLVRRQCVLQVDPRAMRRIVDEGYHPQLGARALKRAIEKQLTQPIATHLTAASPTAPAVIDVYRGPEGVLAAVNVLKPVDPVVEKGVLRRI